MSALLRQGRQHHPPHRGADAVGVNYRMPVPCKRCYEEHIQRVNTKTQDVVVLIAVDNYM
jgi:hypothetical protein